MNAGQGKNAARFWTVPAIAWAAGHWLVSPKTEPARLAGLTTDSRAIAPGQVFLALHGDKFDGHDFLPDAVRAGASLVIVDRDVSLNIGTIRVDDTLAALQRLAAAYRRALAADGTKVIAVTGSSGKTSTRALIHAALSSKLTGCQSPKSFNNHVGVPLTILTARPGDDFLVAEVGTNHVGEIAPLADILQPDAAVITNIGSAHLGHFGTRDAIAREKAQLLRRIPPDGLAVLPADCDQLPALLAAVPANANVIRFGSGGSADVRLTDGPRPQPDGLQFRVDHRLDIRLGLLGEHNATNALAAIAVARWFGVPDADVARGLAAATLPDMRMQVLRFGPPDAPITVLNDAYNANLESTWAAVLTLLSYPKTGTGPVFRKDGWHGSRRAGTCPGDAATLTEASPASGARRIAVLGDMLELGEQSARLHRELLQRVAAAPGLHEVLAIGPLMSEAAQGIPGVVPAGAWRDGLADELAARFRGADVVLLKGSRGMKMERVLDALRKRFPAMSD